jgi:hypothetical protein
MELLGDAKNWWLPRWLERVPPRVQVDGNATTDDVVLLTEHKFVSADR